MYDNQEKPKKSLIFRDAGLAHGFSQIPNVVLRDGSLSPNAKTLYALLLSYAWQDGECFPGQMRLADDMGCRLRTIGYTLAELKRRRLISWDRVGLGKSNIYYIEPLAEGYSAKQYIDKVGAIA
jgi:hypothetical protein